MAFIVVRFTLFRRLRVIYGHPSDSVPVEDVEQGQGQMTVCWAGHSHMVHLMHHHHLSCQLHQVQRWQLLFMLQGKLLKQTNPRWLPYHWSRLLNCLPRRWLLPQFHRAPRPKTVLYIQWCACIKTDAEPMLVAPHELTVACKLTFTDFITSSSSTFVLSSLTTHSYILYAPIMTMHLPCLYCWGHLLHSFIYKHCLLETTIWPESLCLGSLLSF